MLKKSKKIKKNIPLILLILTLIILISHTIESMNLQEIDIVNKCENDSSKIIILTASQGAKGFGHTTLLLKKENDWHYFSWQSKKVVFKKVPEKALINLKSFNTWIKENDSLQNYHADFDSILVIEGQFDESFEEAEKIFINYLINEMPTQNKTWNYSNPQFIKNLEKNEEYDLFFNNCVDKTYEILSKGDLYCNKPFNETVKEPSFISNLAKIQLEKQLDKGLSTKTIFYS